MAVEEMLKEHGPALIDTYWVPAPPPPPRLFQVKLETCDKVKSNDIPVSLKVKTIWKPFPVSKHFRAFKVIHTSKNSGNCMYHLL
jgi:hypothetical protein